ncbi:MULTISPECIES: hypothetical protein [unclassified Streptococcus]|uniref:hypothetical protein n=1 Tax=unclassified Streptococcus TaxID=2608887 RepID=UPI00102150E6|nr:MULTISPECIES: hypothetical protein [unclassified Streptococcus]MTQ42579.1 hypothetical protein [Streptococcus sp. BIOML-A1]RYS59418.1 hypothetical protein EAI95_08010 [Streptococcus sp. bf_0095]
MKRESKEVQNPIPISVNGFKANVENLNRLANSLMALGDSARKNVGLDVTSFSAIKSIESVMLNSLISKSAEIMKSSGVKEASEVLSEIQSQQVESLKKIAEIVNNTISTFDKSYLEALSSLSNAIAELQPLYSDEEYNKIRENIILLASKGWVVFFQNGDPVSDLISDNLEELETKWYSLLEDIINNSEKIADLGESDWYSKPLVKSMVDSYSSGNYYSAYTLATIAIDGAINRFYEKIETKSLNRRKKDRIQVGYRAVKVLDQKLQDELTSKTIYDIGLISWLNDFFAYTPCFKSEKPNRHMISHGRWKDDMSKEEFLKLFNVLLYINESFDFWYEEILELGI